MFKENRQLCQHTEGSGKTDIGRGAKGIATLNPHDTAEGLMGGVPSPPDKLIAESRELQESDPEGIVAKVKRNVITVLKTPTTLAKSALDTGHGAIKWGTLQVNKAIQQTRNLVAVTLAIPVKLWEVTSYYPKVGIKKITDTTHAAVDKVIGFLPSNPPRQDFAPSPA